MALANINVPSVNKAAHVNFMGATSISGGKAGLVPAPAAGEEDYFLRGDGTWATDDSKGGGGTVLNTVPATVDGGFWYEANNNVLTLNLHKGSFNYSFNYDRLTYRGDNSHLVAYLPFDVLTMADACGNTWTPTGNPTIVDGALSLDGSSYLTNSTISNSIGEQPWTIDFWATVDTNSGLNGFFGTTKVSGTGGSWICISWNNGKPMRNFCYDDRTTSLELSTNTRHHYALTYDETAIRFFVDGTLQETLTRSVRIGNDFIIGARPDKSEKFHGSIDHFRIFKGIALWTEDFTPPASADYL